MTCDKKGHTYLNKPVAFSCIFFLFFMIFCYHETLKVKVNFGKFELTEAIFGKFLYFYINFLIFLLFAKLWGQKCKKSYFHKKDTIVILQNTHLLKEIISMFKVIWPFQSGGNVIK